MNNIDKKKSAWEKLNNGMDKVNKVINPIVDVANKGMSASAKTMHKVSEKTVNSLNDVQSGNKTIKCPRCKNTNVTFMENDKKGFSVGKAVGGTILAGGVGSLAGFTGKKGKKNKYHCNDCGYEFKK